MKYIYVLLLSYAVHATTQSSIAPDTYWELTDRQSIILRMDDTRQLPHKDNIELSGKKVSAIIYYSIDEDQNLSIQKDVIFPQLRTYNRSNEPDWKKYRAYFRRTAGLDMLPQLSIEERIIVPSKVDSIEIAGMIVFYYTPVNDLQITKTIYPSMDEHLLIEEWHLTNLSNQEQTIDISPCNHQQSEQGYKGRYTFIVESQTADQVVLPAGENFTFPVIHGALLNGQPMEGLIHPKAKNSRLDYLQTCRDNLVLRTPNDTLNQLFEFSKIRAAESIFNSSMGLIHSPGGGSYYVGIWANDQIEYGGPFFPYLGYESGNIASYNAYKKFLENTPTDGGNIAYAFEVDGNFPMTHQDRGDAAMIAYGTSLFLLNSGDEEQAQELWPLIEWSLTYCHNQRNEAGAVQSESDEMEGRIETGDANLSTSTLYYGGLKFAARIARALGQSDQAALYEQRMDEMGHVIENYFGATMEGFDTYKYFEANQYLRHWICLPLTMGIDQRKEGTLQALFETLWTDNGVLVQYNPEEEADEHTFWDRATLYALRGALKVGATELAMERLSQYSAKRLLGDHVPYAVEAYPENNMKHLSAESALYCRIFIEGLLGIEPVNFTTIQMTPQLLDDWDYMELESIHLLGQVYDISIQRIGKRLQLNITQDTTSVYSGTTTPNESVELVLRD